MYLNGDDLTLHCNEIHLTFFLYDVCYFETLSPSAKELNSL